MKKLCNKCNTEKEIRDFFRDKYTKDGYTYSCKLCRGNKSNEQLSEEKQEKLIHLKTGLKTCKYCKHEYTLSEFVKDKYARDKLSMRCKTCWKPIWEAKRSKYAPQRKNYNVNKKFSQPYMEKKRRRERERRQNPFYKMSNNISLSIRRSLSSSKNGNHWELVVGYSLNDLQIHLEKQFVVGMTWKNYGIEWHIDHKRPICSFNITSINDEEFKRCWALDNLQPLWAMDNWSKNGKWPSL